MVQVIDFDAGENCIIPRVLNPGRGYAKHSVDASKAYTADG